MKYSCSLELNSGLGHSILAIISSIYYLKINNIDTVLNVNTINASEPVKVFINYFLDKDNIKCINFICEKLDENYKELFFRVNNPYVDVLEHFDKYVEIFNKIWILKPFVKEECDKLNKYDICINIRRGDKVTLEPSHSVTSIDSYIDEINKINLNNPKIFHTSDEYDSFIEIKNKNINWDISTLTSTEEKGFFLAEMNTKDIEYNINHIMKFMKQLHIIKNSNYFIGTLVTNVGFISQLLRNIRFDEKNIYI